MKHAKWIAIAALSALFLVFSSSAFAGNLVVTGTAPQEKLNVRKNTVTSNVTVMGKSLSGLTYEKAVEKSLQHFNSLIKAELYTSTAEGDETWSKSFAELGIVYDTKECTEGLKNYVLKGSLLDRYKLAKSVEKDPVDYDGKVVFNESYIRETVLDAVKEWNGDPVESTATCVTGELVVNPGKSGHEYDFTDTLDDFFKALRSNDVTASGFELKGDYTTIEPTLTADTVAGFSVIGTCTTNYVRPHDQISRNRQQNLAHSTSNMSGRVFAPGETISALDLYGAVTVANGYAVAGTYTSTGHTDEIGGGICQTTSTMYNAVLMAELDVVYRKNHSYLITYLDPSMDAMVYAQGGSDFKFRNSSSDYIIIDAYIDTEKCTLTVNLIGHEDHPATHSVRYETQLVSATLPTLTRVEDTSRPLGWDLKYKYTAASDFSILPAVRSCLIKITNDNGVETRTQIGGIDSYKPMNDQLICSADVEPHMSLYKGWEIRVDVTFIDSNQTRISANPEDWTPEQRVAFNTEMTALMAEKGLVWPDTGDGFTLNGEVKVPDTWTSGGGGEEGGEGGEGGEEGESGSEGGE